MDSRDALIARAVVAALGELVQPPWWRSQFLKPSGLSTLRRVLPRTYLAGAVRSASGAAAIEHDRHVGRGNHFHLYRLPPEIERSLAETLDAEDMLAFLEPLLRSGQDALVEQLARIANGVTAKPATGPVLVGRLGERGIAEYLPMIAALYLEAFRRQAGIYPYLEGRPAGERTAQ